MSKTREEEIEEARTPPEIPEPKTLKKVMQRLNARHYCARCETWTDHKNKACLICGHRWGVIITMKAISIKEPWISLIVKGEKLIETRTWYTDHRGPLLLVGSKRPEGPYSGVAACVVILKHVRPMCDRDEFLARCENEDGLYSWILADIREVEPVEIKGKLGMFDVPAGKIKYVE